ncbi:MAG: hypothetical protein OXU20_24620 [Myxococcales bacterium]|nr:hypothetical protein [Myxococcales bacterium]
MSTPAPFRHHNRHNHWARVARVAQVAQVAQVERDDGASIVFAEQLQSDMP